MELSLNLNQLESYSLVELKAEYKKVTEEFFNTFDRSLSAVMQKINNVINSKFVDDIDLSYYTYNDIQNLTNTLVEEIIKYMDNKINEKSCFEHIVKFISEDNKENGNLKSIEKSFLLNKYNIELNFTNVNKLHQLIKTLMHELRHVYQYEYSLFNFSEEANTYDYINRPFEVDARNYVNNNFDNFVKLVSNKIYPMFSKFEIK